MFGSILVLITFFLIPPILFVHFGMPLLAKVWVTWWAFIATAGILLLCVNMFFGLLTGVIGSEAWQEYFSKPNDVRQILDWTLRTMKDAWKPGANFVFSSAIILYLAPMMLILVMPVAMAKISFLMFVINVWAIWWALALVLNELWNTKIKFGVL